MAKARVELTKAESHEGRGRTFKKKHAQVITKEADIAYYKAQPEFTVTMLKDPPIKPKAPAQESEESEETEPEVHTEESLGKLTKTQLINLGTSEPFNLAIENEMKKGEMIDAILIAQGEDED